ncbi:hypothetical protein BDQ12DRAFT_736619 [Crucibulum laeve]|uniref:Uncharacterized protein n=1 Tax=Crucibulum laeve TaxID=68775 RepID=A0A5C3LYC8_9AGAR|nr:hypothetical protein BDQ12DRAFT_736619 [Crucibulum laeve]
MNTVISANSFTYAQTNNTSNLKRTHPGGHGKSFNSAHAPPLPKIGGDLILQVFTHKSLRRKTGSDNPEHYGDNERLSELGKIALEATVTNYLFMKRPFLTAAEMISERNEILSDEAIDEWVTFYGLRNKLRCHPDLFATLSSPQETRSIFYAYVGGVYADPGSGALHGWINQLLEGRDVSMEPSEPALQYPIAIPPPKKIKSEPSHPSSIFFASQPTVSPVKQTSPARPSPAASVGNPLAPAQPGLPFLPLFNQTAMQRRVTVEYPAEFSGPSHAGRWSVQCVVNGIPKGTGTGSSKQVAKEEAARQAYYAMGWT